ncbi:hypothetical protein [Anabaena azotica]|uniref:hypothetical protein n=1 Tax=Anabaena azotica TaxID=197653 RepID=UPI0039A54A83
MNSLSSLDEVAQDLEQDPNSKRIKKLIFCACKNIWANDQEMLDRYTFKELIQELCSLNPNREYLNYTLSQIVNSLNKPAEYAIIASIILNKIDKLYLAISKPTETIFNQSDQQESTEIISHQPQQQISSNNNYIDQSINYQIKYEYNQFDLRQNIMAYTNPLRAKIVIFSALYHRFTFKTEDWLKLRAIELDSLLEKLFDSCSTIIELELKINNSVISLGNQDENAQTASTIIRFMKSFYSNVSNTAKQYQQINSYSFPGTQSLINDLHQPTLTDMDDIYENDVDDNNNTCQLILPPTPDMLKKKTNDTF